MLIRGNSMVPSYRNMQFTILDRHGSDFSYGDVIAFRCDSLSSILVKRVAACPGDTVIIKGGTLYINNTISKVYPEMELFEYAGVLDEETHLNENQYIVIGDNVSESKDSRFETVSSIERKNILGKIVN